MELTFATHNPHKLQEIQKMCPPDVRLISLTDLGVTREIPETGMTIEENSALKARYVFDNFQNACFADDSGLEVRALDNAPGVHSARYAGEPKNDQANLSLLLRKLSDIAMRSANFKTVITYIDSSGLSHQFTGIIKGEIALAPKGTNGFGYDPVFLPEGYSVTFAEMPDTLKNTISHRALAFKKFIDHLNREKK